MVRYMTSEMAYVDPSVARCRRRLMAYDLTEALGRSPCFDFLVDVLPATPITAVRRVHAGECPSPPKPADVTVPPELLVSSSSEESESEHEPDKKDVENSEAVEEDIVFEEADFEFAQHAFAS
ncbi:hypothetical protein Pmar_PMAR010687 [Perkinsus marinus ATCC 50983]|uniref:Uncharacterized protein n=1 Tax=Perkinsus marinus (strain ATCC 50983 / TXsc) TaxID=423536 RepID=C5KBR9_PERM5|nr:hypothetical protein Pmar_PMAR010687 [Perkinsus marinus ATCC 50983]EER18074.1 hypothetical protein Pmar_PMAR010687 [Perkinsus marinus ATCC 50983]|eukprot:XP_002786278.1 hypothetical protein Pmar_PMAR010687 [Perkinsus marinus ATCC 50983]